MNERGHHDGDHSVPSVEGQNFPNLPWPPTEGLGYKSGNPSLPVLFCTFGKLRELVSMGVIEIHSSVLQTQPSSPILSQHPSPTCTGKPGSALQAMLFGGKRRK